MLQSVSSVFIVYRRKTLTGSLDPMHANGKNKPCIDNVLEPPFVVFSFCKNIYQKVGVLLESLWQLLKLKIHKWIFRHDHLNISTMHSIFDYSENPEINVLLKEHKV